MSHLTEKINLCTKERLTNFSECFAPNTDSMIQLASQQNKTRLAALFHENVTTNKDIRESDSNNAYSYILQERYIIKTAQK